MADCLSREKFAKLTCNNEKPQTWMSHGVRIYFEAIGFFLDFSDIIKIRGFTDADNFEPKLPTTLSNKWEGEDEEENVKVTCAAAKILSESLCKYV